MNRVGHGPTGLVLCEGEENSALRNLGFWPIFGYIIFIYFFCEKMFLTDETITLHTYTHHKSFYDTVILLVSSELLV